MTESRRGEEMLRLMKELKDMPEHALYTRLMALNTSIYILDQNHKELYTLIVELTSDERHRELFLVENREALHRVSLDVVRRMHNFLSAALSLREHALGMFNKYYRDHGLMPEYRDRVRKEFGEDPLAQFMIKLRVFFQHYQSPHMNYVTAWDEEGNAQRRAAIIRKEDLVEFDDWNEYSKQFVESIELGVDILDVAGRYRVKVLEFYKWFQLRQSEIHSEELEKFGKKEAELQRVQVEDRLERYTVAPSDERNTERGLFFGIFTASEFIELEELGNEAKRRASRSVQLLEKHFPISEHMKEQVGDLYESPGFLNKSPQET